ncbi:MAG: alpha/beta hydrolase [Solirubrobacterales bacterium]
MIWAHGGAFCFNSPRVYSTFLAHLARALGVSVLAVGYRLAPEHPYPAALEDVLDAWREVSRDEEPLLLGGDSAGGGIALSSAIALRDAGDRGPLGLYLMSPWVDLAGAGESIGSNAQNEALLRAGDLPPLARAYAGDLNLGDPRVSPLNAELGQLPPTLIQAGGDELFLSECTELASRLEAAGTQAELQVFDDVWHDFQVHAGMLRESDEALERVASWAKPLLESGIAER